MRGRRQLQRVGGVAALPSNGMCRSRATDRWLTAQVTARPLPCNLVQTWVAVLFARETGIHPCAPATEAGIIVALFLRRSYVFGDFGQEAGYVTSRAFQGGDCSMGLTTL